MSTLPMATRVLRSDSHSITVAVEVVLSVNFFSCLFSSCAALFAVEDAASADPDTEAPYPLMPTLAPADVAMVLATVLPAVLMML